MTANENKHRSTANCRYQKTSELGAVALIWCSSYETIYLMFGSPAGSIGGLGGGAVGGLQQRYKAPSVLLR